MEDQIMCLPWWHTSVRAVALADAREELLVLKPNKVNGCEDQHDEVKAVGPILVGIPVKLTFLG